MFFTIFNNLIKEMAGIVTTFSYNNKGCCCNWGIKFNIKFIFDKIINIKSVFLRKMGGLCIIAIKII